MTRRDFILLVLFSPLLAGAAPNIIRPPGTPPEDKFVNRCIRCGSCMKVCITNGLQPALLEAGLSGIWTPKLVPEIGYCEYRCTLCGNVCPTGAIPALTVEEKSRTRLGQAHIDRSICLPWSQNIECTVCQRHCPVPGKTIKLEGGRPYVEPGLCVGCGTCQNKCPVRPRRAIRVYPN